MDLKLTNKVIIVTGGSSGIGYGITTALVAEGAIPFIIGRTEKRVLDVVEAIKKNGNQVGYAIAELTNPKECEAAIEKVVSEYVMLEKVLT